MKTRIFLLSFVCISLTASLASAQDLRLDLRIGAQVLPDESVDFLSDGNTIPTQTLRVSSELLPNTRVVVEYGSEAPAEVFRHREIDALFLRHRFMVGADWGPTLFGFLRPFVGATAGYTLGVLDFKTSSIRYHDYSHDVMADLYLGTEATVALGSDWFLTGGLRFGGRLQTAAEFDEAQTNRTNDPWEREDPKLGTIYPNGWYVDFGVGVGLAF